MNAGIFARLPAVAVLIAVALLATATLTLAATSTGSAPQAPAATAAPEQEHLVVPDVRRQAYVFAKGALEQAGFAWKVGGSVQGYAANLVVSQSPAPGARVIADGAPIVTVSLTRNSAYAQEGEPENASPFAGRPARLVVPERPAAAVPRVAAKPKQVAVKPAVKPAAARPKSASRKPDFAVPGAPLEPLDEITLVARAKRLASWVEANPTRTPRNVNHWLYQHSWIVAGAQFGWADGTAALRELVAVDRRVQKLWGVGARSESVARKALARVERQAGA